MPTGFDIPGLQSGGGSGVQSLRVNSGGGAQENSITRSDDRIDNEYLLIKTDLIRRIPIKSYAMRFVTRENTSLVPTAS